VIKAAFGKCTAKINDKKAIASENLIVVFLGGVILILKIPFLFYCFFVLF